MSYEVIGWKQAKYNWLLIFNMVLLSIQAGTLMGNNYFYEQPVIQEGNQIYRFGCPAFEIGTLNFKHCVINEQSYESLWYYSYGYMYIMKILSEFTQTNSAFGSVILIVWKKLKDFSRI